MTKRTTLFAFAAVSLGLSTRASAAVSEPTPGTVWAAGVSTTPHPAATLGPAFALGVGAQTGGLGGQVALEVPTGSAWVVAPWIGVGRMVDTTVAAGVSAKVGETARFVVDASVMNFDTTFGAGLLVKADGERHTWGAAQLGVEVMVPVGGFVRVLVGGAAGPTGRGVSALPVLSLALGAKVF